MFTCVWAFDQPSDWDCVAKLTRLYEDAGAQVDYVELVADQSVRFERNRTENRLKEKPSKRNVALSEQLIRHAEEKYRCVSEPGEIPYASYLRLDNTNLTPEQAAEIIVDHFGYQRTDR